MKCFICIVYKIIIMNENLYRLFDDVLISSFNIKTEGNKTVLELGDDAEFKLE